jgi:hypothetical protein
MASAGRSSVNESGSATNEGIVTSGSDNDEGLTTLDSGGSVALVALVLVDSKGLASDGRLINLEEGILGNDAAIGGDNGTFLDLQDIAGNNLGGLDLLESTVTQNNSLESECLLQLVDNGTSLVFLDETDGGVEEQQSADDTEIDPVLKTGSKNSGGLSGGQQTLAARSALMQAMFLFRAHFRVPPCTQSSTHSGWAFSSISQKWGRPRAASSNAAKRIAHPIQVEKPSGA